MRRYDFGSIILVAIGFAVVWVNARCVFVRQNTIMERRVPLRFILRGFPKRTAFAKETKWRYTAMQSTARLISNFAF